MARAVGEVGLTDDDVLVIQKIRVTYTLKVPAEQRETAERVHGYHQKKCPVARSLEPAIDISTALEMIEPDA